MVENDFDRFLKWLKSPMFGKTPNPTATGDAVTPPASPVQTEQPARSPLDIGPGALPPSGSTGATNRYGVTPEQHAATMLRNTEKSIAASPPPPSGLQLFGRAVGDIGRGIAGGVNYDVNAVKSAVSDIGAGLMDRPVQNATQPIVKATTPAPVPGVAPAPASPSPAAPATTATKPDGIAPTTPNVQPLMTVLGIGNGSVRDAIRTDPVTGKVTATSGLPFAEVALRPGQPAPNVDNPNGVPTPEAASRYENALRNFRGANSGVLTATQGEKDTLARMRSEGDLGSPAQRAAHNLRMMSEQRAEQGRQNIETIGAQGRAEAGVESEKSKAAQAGLQAQRENIREERREDREARIEMGLANIQSRMGSGEARQEDRDLQAGISALNKGEPTALPQIVSAAKSGGKENRELAEHVLLDYVDKIAKPNATDPEINSIVQAMIRYGGDENALRRDPKIAPLIAKTK